MPALEPEVRRWLHDKYQRLAAEEGQLAANRTSYFAVIGTVLITGLVVGLYYFMAEHRLLVLVVTFLASIGIIISLLWTIVLTRTTDAQLLWRQGAQLLERLAPPVDGELRAPVRLGSGATLELDLLRPFTAHAQRFSPERGVSWMDRVSPNFLIQILPISFLVIWVTVLILAWWVYWS